MKILTVYNTCGIHKDNTAHYIKTINDILEQEDVDQHVVLSSCLNSMQCFKEIYKTFGKKISYNYFAEAIPVNITFNKTVQECVKKFGNFDGYLYIASDVSFETSKKIIASAANLLKTKKYGIVSVQVDKDGGYHTGLDPEKYVYYTPNQSQIKNKDLVVPIGKLCNMHVFLYSHDFYENFNQKIIPDVFKAYCTESTFSFLNAAINKKWVIMKDLFVRHFHQTATSDFASSCAYFKPGVGHVSKENGTTWNNLMCERDALDFINDPEAKECGLGYEELADIMLHNKEAYDEQENALFPDRLKKSINKHFFLTKKEFDYDKIKSRFVV